MMKSGVATFTNLPGYIAWMESMGLRGWKAIYSIINKTRYGQEWSKSFPDIEKLIVPAFAEQYTVRSWSSYPPTETEEAKWPGVLASTRKKLETVQYMNSEMEQPIHVRFWLSIGDETLGADEKERKEFTDVGVQGMAGIYIGNRDKFLIIVNPDEYMDFTPDADYSDMSPAMLRASIDTPRNGDDQQLIPSAAENMTPASVHTALEGEQQHLEKLKAQMEAVKNGSAPELKELTEATVASTFKTYQLLNIFLMENAREGKLTYYDAKNSIDNFVKFSLQKPADSYLYYKPQDFVSEILTAMTDYLGDDYSLVEKKPIKISNGTREKLIKYIQKTYSSYLLR